MISTGVTFLAFQAMLEGWPMMRLNNPYRAPEEACRTNRSRPEPLTSMCGIAGIVAAEGLHADDAAACSRMQAVADASWS